MSVTTAEYQPTTKAINTCLVCGERAFLAKGSFSGVNGFKVICESDKNLDNCCTQSLSDTELVRDTGTEAIAAWNQLNPVQFYPFEFDHEAFNCVYQLTLYYINRYQHGVDSIENKELRSKLRFHLKMTNEIKDCLDNHSAFIWSETNPQATIQIPYDKFTFFIDMLVQRFTIIATEGAELVYGDHAKDFFARVRDEQIAKGIPAREADLLKTRPRQIDLPRTTFNELYHFFEFHFKNSDPESFFGQTALNGLLITANLTKFDSENDIATLRIPREGVYEFFVLLFVAVKHYSKPEQNYCELVQAQMNEEIDGSGIEPVACVKCGNKPIIIRITGGLSGSGYYAECITCYEHAHRNGKANCNQRLPVRHDKRFNVDVPIVHKTRDDVVRLWNEINQK